MRRGRQTAMYVDLRQVVTMGIDLERFDTSCTSERWRVQCWRNGRRFNSVMWLDRGGAKQIPQKSIIKSNYRKLMFDYWRTLDPQHRERAQHMYKYVKSPDPRRGRSAFP